MKPEEANELLLAELDETLREKLALSGHCAQASFAALDQYYALGGGPTLRGETCGAVLGPLLALGLVFGRERLDDQAGFLQALPPSREFCRRFEQEVGSTRCADILESNHGRSFDLARQADFKAYCDCGGLESCSAVIRSGVRIAATIILEHESGSVDPGVLLTA